MKGLAMRFFALHGSHILANAVARSAGIELDDLEEREFPDGEHKSRPLVSVRNEDVFVLHSLHGNDGRTAADRLLRLLFFIGTCRDNGASRVTAIVPYLAFMRKEQQTKARDPVSSRYVAELFEAVGTHAIVALEVHNIAAFQNAFRCRNVHLDMRAAFASRIRALAGSRPIVLLSPDSGGMKRTHLMAEAIQKGGEAPVALATMEKHRSEGSVSGGLFAGAVEGAAVFILDDLIATGGTIVRAAEACRARGAAAVHAVATHGLFSSAEQLLSPAIDTIIVTDSISAFPPSASKLEVISCAPLLGGAIQRLHGGGSIHRLLHPQR
jgi:ribose-phosphate pyrophosphokinase